LRNISDTIARLAALRERRGYGSTPSGGADRLTDLDNFGSNTGALKARHYVPHGLPHGAPLVVVLHGCTQDAAGYDHHSGWSRLADEAGFAILYPEQQRSNNANLCFNWFQRGDVARDSGEALSIRQMIETMVETHALDRKRICVTGLSAGGAMACAMLASYPEVFAAGAVLSGLAFGSATTVPEAFDRMRGHGTPSDDDLRRMLRDASPHRGPWPRISIWQGTTDQTVAATNADVIASQWWGVHQVGGAPTHSQRNGNHLRKVWCDSRGDPVMEVNMIAGMGHGTPVDASRLGAAGPYMLDVGISSTHAIAEFWGIAEAAPQDRVVVRPHKAVDPAPHNPMSNPPASPSALPQQPGGLRESPSGLQNTIENALRSAGLMR
jgi:poly(hydroxyalkanoate) depolymerase family esterase